MERFSWFDVPDDVKNLLLLAAETWENTEVSENYINQALAKTETDTDVLVAAYRFFYYKNNYNLALQTAVKVIDKIVTIERLPSNWSQLKVILLSRKQDPKIRLYLNAYAASGLVLAKLGEIEKAKEICSKIQEVDSSKEFLGANILLDILTRPPEEE